MHARFLFSLWGWVVLGAAAYLLYQTGKKAGEKNVEKQEQKVKAA